LIRAHAWLNGTVPLDLLGVTFISQAG